VVEPLVAEIVAVSPLEPPDNEKDGVVSPVTSSVLDEPVSEAEMRSGAIAGAVGAVVSTTRLIAGLVDDTFPEVSVTVDVTLHVPSVSPERSHDCVPVPMT